ncbi:MAG: penicillin-insensitive murein endopeptidase [Rhodospirillales bacterium]|nr:penicillin-insensitive murein endopeptidase [Rhodospirillales bacterium]
MGRLARSGMAQGRRRRAWGRAALFAAFALLAVPATVHAQAPLRIVGGPSTGGCIQGAVHLPLQGQGFQTIHLDRSAFWGAPQTIARIELLAQWTRAAGLPDLLIEDISARRGGPLPGGHLSHQVGLDADVGLDMTPRPPLDAAARDDVVLASLVRPDGRGIEPSRWSPRVVTLLRLAAGLPDVDRILVNPAIKQQLCRDVTGDRSWLRLIRPWYGHAAHMHIRFRCPPGQAECAQMPPPPEGDGCDATLQWWFDQLDKPPRPSGPVRVPTPPAACRAILAGR